MKRSESVVSKSSQAIIGTHVLVQYVQSGRDPKELNRLTADSRQQF